MALTKGLLVDAYLNLHKPGFLSIRAVEGADKGRVIGYATALELSACTFRVSEAGRQRVLREKRKNVHATVRGRLVSACMDGEVSKSMTDMVQEILGAGGAVAYYSPYRTPTFINQQTRQPIYAASKVVIVGKTVASTGERDV